MKLLNQRVNVNVPLELFSVWSMEGPVFELVVLPVPFVQSKMSIPILFQEHVSSSKLQAPVKWKGDFKSWI